MANAYRDFRLLLFAMRDTIKTRFGYRTEECEVMSTGKPPPRCGKVFVAVHRGPWRNQARNRRDYLFSVHVTLTMRINEPFDRLGTDLMGKPEVGLDDRADQIANDMVLPYDVMNAANTLVDPTMNGFCEPLSFEGGDEVREVGGDWFHARGRPEAGLACTLRFGGARLVRAV